MRSWSTGLLSLKLPSLLYLFNQLQKNKAVQLMAGNVLKVTALLILSQSPSQYAAAGPELNC